MGQRESQHGHQGHGTSPHQRQPKNPKHKKTKQSNRPNVGQTIPKHGTIMTQMDLHDGQNPQNGTPQDGQGNARHDKKLEPPHTEMEPQSKVSQYNGKNAQCPMPVQEIWN